METFSIFLISRYDVEANGTRHLRQEVRLQTITEVIEYFEYELARFQDAYYEVAEKRVPINGGFEPFDE